MQPGPTERSLLGVGHTAPSFLLGAGERGAIFDSSWPMDAVAEDAWRGESVQAEDVRRIQFRPESTQ